MIAVILVAALLLVMGIVILLGKGDNLIAGYNTASEQEKAKYNIKRLRGLLGGFLIILAPMLFLMLNETVEALGAFMVITTVLCIIVVILANTWAKK